MAKVIIFKQSSCVKLEDAINSFLKESQPQIQSISFSTKTDDLGPWYIALLLYN